MPPIESALRKLAVIQEKYLEVILPTVLVFTAVIVFWIPADEAGSFV